MTTVLVLPYPPSVNHYKSVGRIVRTSNGKLYQKRVNSNKTLQFYHEVWLRIRQEGVISFGKSTISVSVDVYPPDKRRRDIDNLAKLILDSLQRGGLYDDDYQIARLLVVRRDIIPLGQIIVSISEIENENE